MSYIDPSGTFVGSLIRWGGKQIFGEAVEELLPDFADIAEAQATPGNFIAAMAYISLFPDEAATYAIGEYVEKREAAKVDPLIEEKRRERERRREPEPQREEEWLRELQQLEAERARREREASEQWLKEHLRAVQQMEYELGILYKVWQPMDGGPDQGGQPLDGGLDWGRLEALLGNREMVQKEYLRAKREIEELQRRGLLPTGWLGFLHMMEHARFFRLSGSYVNWTTEFRR